MYRPSLTRQRLAGIFLVGLLLLFSPILTLFDLTVELAGFPISYVYLFGVWLGLILLLAWTVEDRNK